MIMRSQKRIIVNQGKAKIKISALMISLLHEDLLSCCIQLQHFFDHVSIKPQQYEHTIIVVYYPHVPSKHSTIVTVCCY